MAFLRRNKSQKVSKEAQQPKTEQIVGGKEEMPKGSRKRAGTETKAKPQQLHSVTYPVHQEQRDPVSPLEETDPSANKAEKRKSRFDRRQSLFGRSKSLDSRRSMEGRPRTANKSALDRTPELPEHHDLPKPQFAKGQQMLGETIEIQSGGDTFNFPTPSPRLPPQKSATLQADKDRQPSSLTALPIAVESAPTSPPAGIGLALGSPTQAPPTWGRSLTSDAISGRMPAQPRLPMKAATQPTIMENGLSADDGVAIPQLRKKKSGWKTLGAFFGRKPKEVEPFYKVQIPQQQYTAPSFGERQQAAQTQPVARPVIETPSPTSPGGLKSPASISSHHSRSPSITRGLARFEARAEADRQSFMPNIESKMVMRTPSMQFNRESMMKPLPGPAPKKKLERLDAIRDSGDMFKPLPEEAHDPRMDSPMSQNAQRYVLAHGNAGGATPRMPRLDVAVESGEMERYSVMFEKLLEPRQSILERRQSKARMRQKSLVKKDLPTTPTLGSTVEALPEAHSERLMQLAPTVYKPQDAKHGVPQRSVTSPHMTRVPSLSITVTPAAKDKSKIAAKTPEPPATALHRPRPIQRSKTAPPGSVSPVARNFSRPKAPTFASSDSSDDVSQTSPLYGENSLPPTPTTITTVADNDAAAGMPIIQHDTAADEPSWDMLTSNPSHVSPKQVSPERHLRPRVKSPEDLERQIVQVSVARQVSVSKARKQVQRAMMEGQRTGARPLKPRVVELGKGVGGMMGQRKSSYGVVIEGGD